MAPSPLLALLALAATTRAWPQLPSEGEAPGMSHTLPVVISEPVSARSLAVADGKSTMGTLTVPIARRSLAVADGKSTMGTLTVPIARRSLAVADGKSTMGTLTVPVASRSISTWQSLTRRVLDALSVADPVNTVERSLRVEDDASGMWALQVIHSTKPGALMGREVEVQAENRTDTSYYVQLSIGNPPQKVYAQIDTGSFELWVNPDCTGVARGDVNFCRSVGFYDTTKSSTANVTSERKFLLYGIGEANVTYVHDSIALDGSPAMTNVQFGVATASKSEFAGILGIGHGIGINTGYKNFIDELASQGITKTKTFSLALGSKTEQEGVIVFGGVDTGKFRGKLVSIPLIPAEKSPDKVARYWIPLQSISNTDSQGNTTPFPSSTIPVFLDSGSTLSMLPPPLASAIAATFGAPTTDNDGFYTVDCSLQDKKASIDFKFNGVTIQVPYKEMIRDLRPFVERCILGITPSTRFTLLGDGFMRAAYVVFDQSTNVTLIAPYANCGKKLKAINTPWDLQGLTGDCDANNAQIPSQSSTSSATTIVMATGSATGTATGTPTGLAQGGDSPAGTDTKSGKGSTSKDNAGARATPGAGLVGGVLCFMTLFVAMTL